MKFTIFGLSISSSWGNGHATLWRGLCAALASRGHEVIFFERDRPYYAAHRDYSKVPGGELILYSSWEEVLPQARRHCSDADVAMATSYCPDAIVASDLMLESRASLRVFYDLDTPVTLARLDADLDLEYIGPRGLRDYDLVLSYTGGPALELLKTRLLANRVAPLYGSVDPSVHHPAPPDPLYRADLSYLGTYSPDRDASLRRLFLEPANRLPAGRFVLGGSKYDRTFPWRPNVFFFDHVRAAEHATFFCSSRLTLNVTREPMAAMGYCPSGRLFEAAACGVPVLSDPWTGLDEFFKPGSELLLAEDTEDVLAALQRTRAELQAIARAGRERTLADHTAEVRAGQLEAIL